MEKKKSKGFVPHSKDEDFFSKFCEMSLVEDMRLIQPLLDFIIKALVLA